MQVCHDCNHPMESDDPICANCGASADPSGKPVTAVDGTSRRSNFEGSALGSFEEILRSNRSDAGRLTLAAFERLCEGEVDDALLAAESAVTMGPGLWTAHLIAGVTRNQRGETEQAEAHLQDALKSEPTAIHYKASLERHIASLTPRRRIALRGGWPAILPPSAWAMIVFVPLLFAGLMWAALTGGGRPDRSRVRERSPGAAPPAALNEQAPYATPAYPAPTPNGSYPAQNPYAAGPSYAPPATFPSVPPLTRPAASAPPPVTRDETPNTGDGSIPASRPGALSRAGDGGPVYPLPPAKPDVSALSDLTARPREGTGNAAVGTAAPEPAPWAKPGKQENPSVGVSVMTGKPVGRAQAGGESPGARSNLPMPSDAVTSSSRIRSAAPPPRETVSSSREPTAPEEARGAGPSVETAVTGRFLQREARRLQNQGRFEEARQAYRDSIRVFQDEMRRGPDPYAASRGLATSKAALDLMESAR